MPDERRFVTAGLAYVDLWDPLVAGGWFLERNGRLYEARAALRDGGPPLDLYHSALEVVVPEGGPGPAGRD